MEARFYPAFGASAVGGLVGALVVLLVLVAAPSTVPTGPPCSLVCGVPLAVGPATVQVTNGNHWYTFNVLSGVGGPVWSNINFSVEAPTGSTIQPTSSWAGWVNQTGKGTIAQIDIRTGTWTSGGGQPIRNDQQIVLYSGTSDLTGRGYELLVVGVNGLSISVSAAIP